MIQGVRFSCRDDPVVFLVRHGGKRVPSSVSRAVRAVHQLGNRFIHDGVVTSKPFGTLSVHHA